MKSSISSPPDFGETHVGPTIRECSSDFGAGSAAGETAPQRATISS